MAEFPEFDEEFKQNVSAMFQDVKEKVSAAILKEDGSLDKEKLEAAARRGYRKAGRNLATGVSKLADFLTNKFGVNGQNGDIVDTHLVVAEPEDFAEEEV